MSNDLNMRLIESAERMIDYHDRLFEIFQRIGSDSKSRIVWLVAISGFAIINLPSVLSQSPPGSSFTLLAVAWVGTALLGAVTHWQFRNRSFAEIKTYVAKRELLLAFLANGPEAATMAELNEIINNKKEPLPSYFDSQLSVTAFVDRLELATMIVFALSMALTIRFYLFT